MRLCIGVFVCVLSNKLTAIVRADSKVDRIGMLDVGRRRVFVP
jgi:hypothetical protein